MQFHNLESAFILIIHNHPHCLSPTSYLFSLCLQNSRKKSIISTTSSTQTNSFGANRWRWPKIGRLKAKTNAMTMINQTEKKIKGANQKSKKKQARKARESKGDREVIEFSSASDWLKEWSEFYGPITVRFEAKPTQPWITFDTQFKIALHT